MPNDLPSGRLSHKPETTIEALTNRVARLQLRGGLGYEAADFFADILAYLASRSAIVEEPMPPDMALRVAALADAVEDRFGGIRVEFPEIGGSLSVKEACDLLVKLLASPRPHTGRAGVSEEQVATFRTAFAKGLISPGQIDDVVRAALNAALTVEPEAPTHQHVKRGSTYTLIGFGKMQAEGWNETQDDGVSAGPSVDMEPVAIYRSTDDGSLWVRPREEFEDGRFIELPARVEPEAGEVK